MESALAVLDESIAKRADRIGSQRTLVLLGKPAYFAATAPCVATQASYSLRGMKRREAELMQ